MRRLVFFVASVVACGNYLVASTIQWDVAAIDHYQGSYQGQSYNWATLRLTSEVADHNFSFDCEVGNGMLTAIPDHSLWTLAFPMNFVEMLKGDVVDETTVRGSEVIYFHGQWLEEPESYTFQDLIIRENEISYLGFAIETEIDNQKRVIYGWLSLIFDGTDVRVGQSAMELSGGPIIIQPRSIPEPGVAMLLCVGAVAFLLKRGNLILALSHNSTIS